MIARKDDYNEASLTENEKEAITDELINDIPGIYNEKQLKRKDRELKRRILSRNIITAYINDDFTELDNALIESYIGDIRDAVNRSEISIEDFALVELRMAKMTYAEIAKEKNIPVTTCFERLKKAQERIMQHPLFGQWEVIMSMLSCEQSNWYMMFRELMEAAEMGIQVKIKII